MKASTALGVKYPYNQKMKDRRDRLMYPSGLEVEFARVMGCNIVPLPFTRNPKTGKPAVIIFMKGVMRRERMEREVPAQGYFIDFGNDIRRGIEIDSTKYHSDILKEQERDEHLRKGGWMILHIRDHEIYNRPEDVRRRVTEFLTK